jgi:hypothetical protein
MRVIRIRRDEINTSDAAADNMIERVVTASANTDDLYDFPVRAAWRIELKNTRHYLSS